MVVLTSADDYENPQDLGCALRFIGQAFKHCKSIAGLNGGESLIKQATLSAHKNAAGVIVGEKNINEMGKKLIKALAEHRHWDREELASSLPY